MIIPRGTESTGEAGVTPRAPGRSPAGGHPRLAAAVTMVCAVAVVGTAHHSAVPAGATAASSWHRPALPWASGAHRRAAAPPAAGAVAGTRTTAPAAATAASGRPAPGSPHRRRPRRRPGRGPAPPPRRDRGSSPGRLPGPAGPRRPRAGRGRDPHHRRDRRDRASSRHRSGLPWASGAYLPADTPAAAAAFGAWRKRPLDIGEVWLSRSTWASITDPAWLYPRWRGSPYTLVVTVPMLPTDLPRVSIRACAEGAYNAHWRHFGRVIRSYRLGSSIIRLGWEFNGKWYPWAATDPTAWAQCWRQAVTSARSTAPRLRWDWNVNRGLSSALADPTRAYPGNGYVSMIGVDSYDQWPAVASAGGWQRQLNGEQGLNYWLRFAKAHGKKLSVPEWGSMRYGRSAGRDDPQYIRDMRAFFAANARYIAFEAIFQGSIGNYDAGRTMPRAAQAYQAGFLSARHQPGARPPLKPRADRKAQSNGRTAPPSRNQPGQRPREQRASAAHAAAASTAPPVVRISVPLAPPVTSSGLPASRLRSDGRAQGPPAYHQ